MPTTKKKKAPTVTAPIDTVTPYLAPVLQAAELLGLKVYAGNVEQLTAVLGKLSHGYPRDVLPPVEALRILAGSMVGSVEELEILEKVWPDFSGDKRFKLTATTLTWQWSSKHTGRYATITVPFPTVLPMTVEVERFCDMDDQANHCDECQIEEWDDCNCESFVEQTVCATVTDWNEQTEERLGAWLEHAVDGEVEPATFP